MKTNLSVVIAPIKVDRAIDIEASKQATNPLLGSGGQ